MNNFFYTILVGIKVVAWPALFIISTFGSLCILFSLWMHFPQVIGPVVVFLLITGGLYWIGWEKINEDKR